MLQKWGALQRGNLAVTIMRVKDGIFIGLELVSGEFKEEVG